MSSLLIFLLSLSLSLSSHISLLANLHFHQQHPFQQHLSCWRFFILPTHIIKNVLTFLHIIYILLHSLLVSPSLVYELLLWVYKVWIFVSLSLLIASPIIIIIHFVPLLLLNSSSSDIIVIMMVIIIIAIILICWPGHLTSISLSLSLSLFTLPEFVFLLYPLDRFFFTFIILYICCCYWTRQFIWPNQVSLALNHSHHFSIFTITFFYINSYVPCR